MIVAPQAGKGAAEVNVDNFSTAGVADEGDASVAVDDVPAAADEPTIPLPTSPTQPPPLSQDQPSTSQIEEGGIIANMDADRDITLQDVANIAKEVAVDAEIEKSADVQGRQAESQVQIYQIDLGHAEKVLSMQYDDIEPAELQEVVEVVTTTKLITKVVTAASATITTAAPQLTTTAAPILTTVASATRRRKGVVIRDPEETATPSTIIHTQPKSKDKGKWIMVHEPKPLKKKTQIEQDEAYARENMAGFKMDYFKEMTYDEICLIFEKKLNSNKLDEEVEKLRKHLQIMQNDDDDDVYTEATPLALKVPVVDYDIYTENNKPYYKIKRADGSHLLYLSFLSMLRNFNKEDLEVLWQLVKEIFAYSKPKNFLDDFLLTTLGAMFKKPDVQSQI
uniref:Uncharacterized protein n=1 Tax=Tanacetum cinerariifolium TaxID=118510 RepID=A0A6L2LBC2_TANCI|nr:hypothetical protein [Tanacetum cinerariifolium]